MLVLKLWLLSGKSNHTMALSEMRIIPSLSFEGARATPILSSSNLL